MTNEMVSKVGPKGQIVIRKMFRDEIGLEEGMLFEEKLSHGGVLIRPIKAESFIQGIEKIARKASKKWPKGISSVDAVRSERK